ncbi:hypothetical protein [Flavobacterium tyrosinilyticum]|uniref:hypothetical protein n=1 Tax=Flavobacterium tyrosinilyticum TaxID=1658740 RepID=UPI00202F6575|nr:hypothetical protein [Flavobacterium tyrosinilyticum]MCM0666399.1 hypothetical protein [Flavobacterium tyrosinilyticum]
MSKKIVVFIEKINKYLNANNQFVYYLLLDFPVINSNEEIFYELIERQKNGANSMLEVKNVTFKKGGIPREGHYYNMPTVFIENNNWTTDSDDGEILSSYMALTYNASDITPRFESALSYTTYSQDSSAGNSVNFTSYINDKVNSDKIEVSVYDVGQGNWNEILFNEEFLIVYDLGASSSQVFNSTYNRITTSQKRAVIINSILKENYSFKKILIISHWDIDHYNGIFELSDAVISSFDFCIVPKRMENDTMRRAFDKLSRNTNVCAIEMNPKGTGAGATSVLTEICTTNVLKIYKGTNCSDRNKRGLLLSLHAKNIDFIFPGDHHYEQIDTFLIPNCNNNELNVVVPHHGGHAGKVSLIGACTKNCSNSIISSGNKHGHPFPYVKNVIEAKFNSMHRTDGCTCPNCTCTSSDYHRII